MKPGVMLINTGRGALIDTIAVIEGLKSAHQAFLTREALAAIAETTIANLDDLQSGRPCLNALRAPT